MNIRFNDAPFRLIGKKGIKNNVTGGYDNQYLGSLLDDKLWVIGVPQLDATKIKKSDNTTYRLYQHDSFTGEFIMGMIIDDYIIGSVHSNWLGTVFEFIDDKNPDKIEQYNKQWIDDGCLFAIKIKGANLEKLCKNFKNKIFTGNLTIISKEDIDYNKLTEEIFNKYLDDKDCLSKGQMKMLKNQGLFLDFIDDVSEISNNFELFFTEQKFVDIRNLSEKFNSSISNIKTEDKPYYNNGSKNNSYQPPEKLKFIIDELNKSGMKGDSIKDIINYSNINNTNKLSIAFLISLTGSEIPKQFNVVLNNSNIKEVTDNKQTKEESITIDSEAVDITDKSFAIDLSNHKGKEIILELKDVPGQIPDDFDFNAEIENGSIDKEWLDLIVVLDSVADLTSRTFKTKMKKINKEISSIVDLNVDDLKTLKTQLG